jgi:hypothetical protein
MSNGRFSRNELENLAANAISLADDAVKDGDYELAATHFNAAMIHLDIIKHMDAYGLQISAIEIRFGDQPAPTMITVQRSE